MQSPSDAVRSFAQLALRHAARSVVPAGGPLVPFALVRLAGGELSLRWCLADDLEVGLESARAMVRSAPRAQVAAVAWDGLLDDGDCALVVEAGAGGASSALFGQRYRDRRLLRRAAVLGSPVLLGRGDPLY